MAANTENTPDYLDDFLAEPSQVSRADVELRWRESFTDQSRRQAALAETLTALAVAESKSKRWLH